jgi:hypothetical protein
MAERRIYDILLTVRSPFMFEGEVNTRTGVDSALLRNQDGHVLIPSSQFRGVLKAALRALEQATSGAVITAGEIGMLFGAKSDDDNDLGTNEPDRGLAIFGDLTGPKPDKQFHTTRIRLDEKTGTVARGALQVIELAAPFGSECEFASRMTVFMTKALDPVRIASALGKALALIPAIGAFKSAGFGEIIAKKSRISEDEKSQTDLAPPPHAPGSATEFWCDMSLDRPLAIDTRRAAENVFESATIIPGGAIKGCIARRLEAAGLLVAGQNSALSDALAQTVFSHAFPVDAVGKRLDQALPLSVCHLDGQFFDAISVPFGQVALIRGRVPEWAAGAKNAVVVAARKRLGLGRLQAVRQFRTHVAIDSGRVAAAEGQLFSIAAIAPKDGRGAPIRWRFRVRLPNAVVKADAAILLGALCDSLHGLGRSACTAATTLAAAPAAPAASGVGNFANIVLLTPALLTGLKPGAQPAGMHAAHQEYFSTMLGGAKLVSMYSNREMAGGHLGKRRRAYGSKCYYPFVLTVPGSVFRLELPDAAARAAVDKALQLGLPVPEILGRNLTWQTCPYMPEHGYGEIAIHEPLPTPSDVVYCGGL